MHRIKNNAHMMKYMLCLIRHTITTVFALALGLM